MSNRFQEIFLYCLSHMLIKYFDEMGKEANGIFVLHSAHWDRLFLEVIDIYVLRLFESL